MNGGRRTPASGGRGLPSRDAGTVTGELAVGLAGVLVVLGGVLAAVVLGQQQLRAVDAAAAGARAVARGVTDVEAAALAKRLAGSGADVRARPQGDLVTVTVRVPVALPLLGGPTVTVSGVARTPTEPQVSGPG